MLHAPSSSEYSEWTCRGATVGELIGVETIGVAADASRASRSAPPQSADVQNPGRVFVAGRAPRGERVRDLYGPRRLGAVACGVGGGGGRECGLGVAAGAPGR